MTKPLIVSLDLEFNQPSKRIIQIGACVGCLATGGVVDTFSMLVEPREPLNPDITSLTGITPEAMSTEGLALAEAYVYLSRWLMPYNAHRHLNPLTWGGGDSEALRAELCLTDARWLFGRRWTDVKTLFVAWRMQTGHETTGGLARAMTKLGLCFEGRKHDALDDAINTFRMYQALQAQWRTS